MMAKKSLKISEQVTAMAVFEIEGHTVRYQAHYIVMRGAHGDCCVTRESAQETHYLRKMTEIRATLHARFRSEMGRILQMEAICSSNAHSLLYPRGCSVKWAFTRSHLEA